MNTDDPRDGCKDRRSYAYNYYMAESTTGGDASELWEAMAHAGSVEANTPAGYGGAGMGLSELAIMGEEMAAAGCPSPMSVISPAIVASILARHGSEKIRQGFLPRMASGDIVLAFAITEPDVGFNAHEVATSAVREADHYRLNGAKYYISGADQAEALLVVARTGTDEISGRGQVSLFVVDKESQGLALAEIDVQINTPERQYTLTLDDVMVPGERLVGEEGNGLRQVFAGLNPERVMGAYARERDVWARRSDPPGSRAPAGPIAHRRRAGEAPRPEGRLAVRRGPRSRSGGQVRLFGTKDLAEARRPSTSAARRPSRGDDPTGKPPSKEDP